MYSSPPPPPPPPTFTTTTTTTILFLFLYFTHLTTSTSPLPPPSRYLTPLRHNASSTSVYFEVTKPLSLPSLKPNCSHLLLQHDFANTYGSPPATSLYSPPSDCLAPWTKIVLEMRASCKGEQYDRIAGVWLGGAELLRTSTAEPTESGVSWIVRKDVTRYSSLLRRSNLTLSVMLENIVNDVFTGVYHVNVSLLYFQDQEQMVPLVLTEDSPLRLGFISKKPKQEIESSSIKVNSTENILYKKPADLIVPVSDTKNYGIWYRIESEADVHFKEIVVPSNAYRAVLEVYVSFHGSDEFWYSNPSNSYIEVNNLTMDRGNGAFREVFVKIDGVFVGSIVPFPVIFTGGINPLFWEPVVAIGAFDLPTYDLDLTPFLGLVLDGKNHSFEIGVSDSIPFWLVDANLHVWLDPNLDAVTAKTVLYRNYDFSVKRKSKFKNLDGSLKVHAKRKVEFSGWVNSSDGNITSYVSHEFKFKNSIEFKNDGQYKEVKQKIKLKKELKVESDSGVLLTGEKFKGKYPLNMIISTLPQSVNNMYLQTTNVSHAQNEKTRALPGKEDLSSVSNSQVSGGWMLVQDHSVLNGTASTSQSFNYKDVTSCYSRIVEASGGKLLKDYTTLTCTAAF